ncbi:MAG: hypothetical protein LBR79_01535 [Oscillospiraceae bacterium]|nr:hypothetical protein [Oscillospiraceae bacterium]
MIYFPTPTCGGKNKNATVSKGFWPCIKIVEIPSFSRLRGRKILQTNLDYNRVFTILLLDKINGLCYNVIDLELNIK